MSARFKTITKVAVAAALGFSTYATMPAMAAGTATEAPAPANDDNTTDIDATLDNLERLVKDLETLVQQNAAGTVDESLVKRINETQPVVLQQLGSIDATKLSEAQEARANSLLERLYAVLSQQ